MIEFLSFFGFFLGQNVNIHRTFKLARVARAVRSLSLGYDNLPVNQSSSPVVNAFGGWGLSTRVEVGLVEPRKDRLGHPLRQKKKNRTFILWEEGGVRLDYMKELEVGIIVSY